MKKYLFLFILTLTLSTNIYASFSVQFTSPTNNQIFTPGTPTGTAPINFRYYVDGMRLYHTYTTELHTHDNVYYEGGNQTIPQWFYLGGGTYTWTIKEIEYDDLGRETGRVEQTITFYVKYTIYAANNFPGGIINLENQTVQAGSNSYAYKLIGESVSVGAIDQNDGAGYYRIWNTSGTNNSNWLRNNGQIFGATSRNYSYTVAGNDNGATLTADLKKICNVTFQNNLPGGGTGGTIVVGGTQYNSPTSSFQVTELNPISATAQNQFLNYIDFTFSQWSNGSASATTTFNPSSNATYSANFTGKPYNGYRYLSIDTTVGQPVKLTWNEHPSTGVTEYRIFRKVRPSGGITSAEVQIGTVARGTTTFTDYDYVLSNMFYYQLYYDVRAYYQPSGSLADPDFISTFGRIAPSYNEGKKEMISTAQELPNEYSIANYPNPFNPTTTINYQLPENGLVTMKVYDVLGKEIATLVNENKSAGYHKVDFDASKLTSGVYIYTINVNGFAQSKKMLLMK